MTQTEHNSNGWADTPEQLKARGTFNAVLPSGARVTLRTITLDQLALLDAIPNDLKTVAFMDGLPGQETGADSLFVETVVKHIQAGEPEIAEAYTRQLLALYERIVAAALVAPEATPDVMAALDGFDREMIVNLAQRRTSLDATGERVTGPSMADVARFRDQRDSPTGGSQSRATGVEVPEVGA